MLFSQRKGIEPITKIFQKDDIDADLRNTLWSALQVCYWDKCKNQLSHLASYIKTSNLESLFFSYWISFFKKPIDTLPNNFDEALDFIRDYFLSCPWHKVYDFIEFTAQHGPEEFKAKFISHCNIFLERENSAYRFVDDQIVEVTSSLEIKEIEEALASTSRFLGIKLHLKTALGHLSNRRNHDYRNSIKESISAVEAISQLFSGDKKASLDKALAVLEKKKLLHKSLKRGFSALYDYTSDADGIRHSMLEEPNLSSTDAKYMLVACTAFINYLLGKAAEIDLKIE